MENLIKMSKILMSRKNKNLDLEAQRAILAAKKIIEKYNDENKKMKGVA